MILARLIRRQFTSTASKATEITPIASKIDVPILPFQNFENLSERLTRQLTKNGVEGLFPIQAATFQAISRGSDVMARARKFSCFEFHVIHARL
jgi:superfamily II DNA/RNA helicase